MAKVEGNDSEVLEFKLGENLPILGQPLRSLVFPRGAIIGSIIRNEEPEIAAGDSVLKSQDRVVVFALPEAIPAVGDLFS